MILACPVGKDRAKMHINESFQYPFGMNSIYDHIIQLKMNDAPYSGKEMGIAC